MTVGTGADAFEAYLLACGYGGDRVMEVEYVGAGEFRTVYRVGDVVYKLGRDSANEYEHRVLTAWRKAGATWAPETSLYRGEDPFAGPYTALAMPYLPDDGRIDADTLSTIKRAAPETCAENVHNCGGQTYLIDGVDVEILPA